MNEQRARLVRINNPVGDNWAQVTYGLVPRADGAQPKTAEIEQQ